MSRRPSVCPFSRRRNLNSAADAASVGHYDFNEIGLSQHELHDVTADPYATTLSTTNGGRQRLTMTSSDHAHSAVHKFVVGGGDSTYHHLHYLQQQQLAAGGATCRMQQTSADCSLGTPMTLGAGAKQQQHDEVLHYAPSVRGMTLLADDTRTPPPPGGGIRYYI